MTGGVGDSIASGRWQPIEVGEEHAAAFGGLEILGGLRGSIPVLVEQATLWTRTERPLGTIEEFTLRALIELGGFDSADDLSNLLGLGHPSFVEPLLARLERMSFVQREPSGEPGQRVGVLVATPALQDLYDKKVWAEVFETYCSCVLDPTTGARYAGANDLLTDDAASEAASETVSGAFDAAAFAEWATSSEGPLRGNWIHDVEITSSEPAGLRCDIVVYADDEDETWWWEPFLPGPGLENPQGNPQGRVAVQWREACRAHGAEEAVFGLIDALRYETPPEPSGDDRAAARVETLTETAAEAAAGTAGPIIRRYNTAESSREIVDRISSARREVIATFPWIKTGALTPDLIEAMERALSAGAHVYVAYGIADDERDDDSHPDAVRRLATLKGSQNDNHDNQLQVVWVGNSHVKEVFVDGEHYLGGSLNRLSFRGDPDRTTGAIRRESMIYTNDQTVIEEGREEIVSVLQQRLTARAAGIGRVQTASEWWELWRPALRLDICAPALQTAVVNAPTRAQEHAAVVLKVLRQVKKLKLRKERLQPLLDELGESLLKTQVESPDEPVKNMDSLTKIVSVFMVRPQPGGEPHPLQRAVQRYDPGSNDYEKEM